MYSHSKLRLLITAVIATYFLFSFSIMTGCQATAAPEITAAPETTSAPDTTAAPETTSAEAVLEEDTEETEEEIMEEAMKIASTAFKPDEMIPSKYTCDGENVNPQLNISGIPEDAESLVLIVDDPDAPGGTWVHWTVWNIDPGTNEIAENSIPGGAIEGVTDFGVTGYGGPCPPSGTHRYFFKVYALDTTLDLDSSATAKGVEDAMQGHILDSAELIGLYERG